MAAHVALMAAAVAFCMAVACRPAAAPVVYVRVSTVIYVARFGSSVYGADWSFFFAIFILLYILADDDWS